MIVFQIYDHVPKELTHCVDSVRMFAQRQGTEYRVFDEDPNSAYDFAEAWANFIRITTAARTPDMLYVDWDIELLDGFSVSEMMFGTPSDALFFTGQKIDRFAEWADILLKYEATTPGAKREYGRLSKIMNIPTLKRFSTSTYRHLQYHKMRAA